MFDIDDDGVAGFVILLICIGGCVSCKCVRDNVPYRYSAAEVVAAERYVNEETNRRNRIIADGEKRQSEQNNQAAIRARRDEKLKAFALREMPSVWENVQRLRAELQTHETSIVRLRKTLQEFGRSPDMDPEYQKLCRLRDNLGEGLQKIISRLEDAYLASEKFALMPNPAEQREWKEKTLRESGQEVEAVLRRYQELKEIQQ